jgi:hypothetical protein
MFGKVLHVWTRFRRKGLAQKYANDEAPIRDELFSSDQMKQHGKVLADSHRIALGRAQDRLLARLAENEGVLLEACDLLAAAVSANRRVAPAGECGGGLVLRSARQV